MAEDPWELLAEAASMLEHAERQAHYWAEVAAEFAEGSRAPYPVPRHARVRLLESTPPTMRLAVHGLPALSAARRSAWWASEVLTSEETS